MMMMKISVRLDADVLSRLGQGGPEPQSQVNQRCARHWRWTARQRTPA
jgi:hypothetical protein